MKGFADTQSVFRGLRGTLRFHREEKRERLVVCIGDRAGVLGQGTGLVLENLLLISSLWGSLFTMR